MPQISVIIPVYNVEKYVEQCVRSVLEQTFADLEVLCVDGGSTDKSAEVLAQCAQVDPRVRIFHVENKGPGHCRNKGLDEARGKYILFVDSDDFLEHNACEILLHTLQQDNLDIAACDFYEYHNNSGKKVPADHRFELSCKYVLDRAVGDGVDEFAKFAFASPFVWGKLYRREIIENKRVRFALGAVEDVPFIVSCLVQAHRVKRLPDYLYNYRVGREGSISGKSERMLLDGIKNFAWLEQTLRGYGVFEEVKETYWFNKMVLLIGDERVFAGRMGNVPPEAVQQAFDLLRDEIGALDVELFKHRNAWFRWKVRAFKKAVANNDLKFPRRLRKLRNIMMIVADPYFKVKSMA